jgi:hypothetical protein
MTTNLYNEAIAEAKKLKEMAEQNAKNKIIEAVTPRIRMLIEQELSDDLEDLDLELDPQIEDEDQSPDGLIDLGSSPDSESISQPMEVEEEIEYDNKNVNINITVEGSKGRNMSLDIGSLNVLRNALNVKSKITLQEGIGKVKRVRKQAIMLKSLLEASNPSLSLNMKLNTVYNKLMSEVDSLGEYQLQDMRESRKFNKLVLETKKEMELMPRKYRRRGWLFEQEEDLGLDAEVGGGGAEEEAPAETEVEASEVEMELQGLIDAIAPESGLEVSVAGGDEDDDDDEEGLDLGDDEDDDDDDLDLEEVYSMVREMEKDEMKMRGKDEMKMREADKDELKKDKDEMKMKEGEHGDKKDEMKMREADKDEDEDESVVEISESMLRREIARLRQRRNPRRSRMNESRLRRIRRRRLLREGDAVEMADQFGGGDAGDEMFVDVDEDTLLNALAEELGEVTPAEGNAAAAAQSFGGGSDSGAALAERRQNRILRKKLAEAQRREKAASAELNKMNLFNAKLLYVNKLMQNRNLSAKQQRAIVEALDNAKTLNEAKLLYKSLTETLNKRSKNSLNESRARTLGSSSKSLRSGSAPANEGAHADRWALLAGLNSKK